MFGRRKPKRDPELDQYTVEPMEPRVLLSADALGVDAGVLDHDSSDQADWDLKDAEDWSRSLASHDTADTAPLAPAGDDTDSRVEIVFLDAGVEDGQQLLADLLSRDGSAITQVHLLDSNSDGVAQIAQVLAGQQDIDAIHIISHGAAGQVQLGSGTLSTGSLDGYTGQLNDWGSALADSGDILIYGCDLAADTQGRALVNAIGILTGADVAASVDQTGHAAQGGDWELEYRAGEVETQTFTMVDLPVWQGTLAAFIVDTAADTVDANPGDGVAEDAAGNTSLRAAIMEANMLAGADTIFLGADNYKISIIGTGDGSGDFDIRSDLSIVGLSPTQTTVDADDLDRVFEVHDDAAYTVSISNLEIVKGLSPASVNGAGLLVQGATNTPDVYLDNVRFKNNDASGAGAMGGAIANSGNLTITNSLIDGNSAPEGGGIWNGPTGVLYMENVTISGNTATVGDGGGLFNEGDATLRHATVTNNTAAGAGGGVIHDNGAVSTDIGNSIIAGNNASTSPDITNTVGIITSAGGNIIQDASGTGTDFAPSERGIDPLLGALADNGGDLMTHAPGAPAIDAADPALAPNTDQRGFLRGDGSPDIGAYEAGATAATTAHYLDEFNAAGSYAGNDGTLLWANEWQEIGEPTDPDFGNVSLWNLLSEDGLYMRWANNMGAWRQADLSGATAAVLSFDWAMTKAGAGVQASIQISTDGVVWTTLDTFNGPLDHSSMQSASYDISAYIDSDTRIRFETLSGFGSNEVFFVDDVRIDISTPAPSTTSLSAVKDTYLWSANPADNFGVDTTLKMDESGAGLGNGHTLLQFDLSTLPAGATITSAVLQMEATGKTGTGADSSVINIYEVTEAWDEGSGGSNNDATWDERQTGAAWGSLGGTVDSTAVASLTTSATGAHTWDITDLVEDWQTGAKTNNGLMLASDDTGTVIFNYDSREGGTPPQLVISYTVPPVDNDPVFQNAGPYNIDEGAAVSTIVGDVDADDGDGGAVDVGITYAITANLDPDGDSNKAFAIDPNTGVITVNDADDLDYEAASSMVITVEADDGVNTETTDVTINIDDVAPTLSVSGAATIKEGEVYTLNLSAAEPGTDDISSWTIDWGDGTTETIAGNPSTATHTYTNAGFTNNILVSATDSGGVTHRVGELISTSLQNDSIYWFDASTGAVNHVENLPGPGNSPVDVQVGPDGEVYVTAFASNKIFRYNADGSFDTIFADAGDGLNNPSRIAFGPDGNLYVTNMSTNEVLRFSGVDGVSSGTAMGAFVSTGLDEPDGIIFGPDGDLYVGNVGTGDVLRFDGVTGALDPTFTANGSSGGYMDIQFGPDGRLWMTNQSSDDIRRYSATDGSFYDIFADTGATDFAGIAFGGDGYVYMSDAMAEDKIIRYPVGDGSAPEPFVLSGTGGLDQPVNITFTPAHQVTVLANQAPVLGNNTLAINEGGTVTLSATELSASDTDDLASGLVFAVSNVNGGQFELTSAPGTAVLSFTQAQITASQVVFVHDGGESAPSYDVTVSDGADTDGPVAATVNFTGVNDAPTVSVPASVFINEIHYDNVGVDTGEAIEIAGVAGNDLNGWSLVMYNGFDGSVYDTVNLSGTIPNQADNFGTLVFNFAVDGIQNATGLPDGIALVDPIGSVVQFLSYEGTFTAVGGPANGMLSTDIGVSEDNGTTAVGKSLQLTGSGATFTWASAASETFGTINAGQDFAAIAAATSQTINEESSLVFSSGNGNAIVVGDVDAALSAAPDPVEITLSVSNGTLTLGSTAGLGPVAGNGSGSIVFTGTIAELNAALEGLTYQPNTDYSGSDTLTVLVDDLGNEGLGGAQTATGTVHITVDPVNDAPTTTPVTLAAVAEDSGPRTITQAELLANAADIEGDSLTATGLAISAGAGALADNGDGTWDYTPALNDDTYVSFSYTISDGTDTVAGSATLDITPLNDAPTTTPVTLAAVAEDSGPRTITQAELLANAADIEGDSLTATGLAISAGAGTLADNGDGTWDYTPAGDDDTAVSFSYTISDGTDTVAGSGTLDITPLNDAPTTTPVTLVAIAEDSGPRTITQAELLANAADIEGDSLTATGLAISAGAGTLLDNGDGTWDYTPAGDDDTNVSFSYTITDGTDNVAGSATLDITPLNDAPTTTPVTLAAVAEDSGPRTITQAELLANAADIEGDSLTATGLAISAGAGTLADNGDGTWDYTPAGDDDTAVSFSYTISDGTDTVAGSGTLDITPLNDAPTTTPVTLVAIAEDSGPRTITQAELLANAADIEGDSLTATGLAISAGAGTLLDNGDGTWDYTPAGDDDTNVSFSYTITDGTDNVAGSATLDITPLNDAPTTTPVTLAAVAEDSGPRTITQAELLANAADIEGDSLTATGLAISAGAGALADNGDGTWDYTPALNDDTYVSFSYTISDGTDTVAGSATLDITPLNDAPTTTPVTLAAIAEDSGPRTITQAELLANAADIEGDSLTATGLAISAGAGTLADNGDGTWDYTPAGDDDTNVSFSYTISDGTDTVAGSGTLDITPLNDAPTTTPVTLVAIAEDSGPRTITQAELLANAADIEGDSLTATGLAISAGAGTLPDNGDGTWDYTPAGDDDTNVSFSYTITDGTDNVAGSATLDITPLNDAPTTTPVTLVAIAEDSGPRTITQAELLANAADIEGDSLTATGLAISAGAGALADNGDGTWDYTPALNDDTYVSFSYTISDGSDTVAGSATLDITPVNDAPTTTPVTLVAIAEDSGARTITQAELLANAADIEGDSLTATGLAISAGAGTLADNGDGTWDYTPAGDDDTAVSFSYTISDGTDTVAGSGTLDITPLNDAPVLGNNQMTLDSGDTVVLTPAMLSATDVDHAAGGLQFTVSAVSGGQFELTSASGVGIFSFTQAQVVAGDVVFVDDGDTVAPAYSVTVGDTVDSVGPRAATIVFNPPTVVTTIEPAPEPVPVIDPAPVPDPKPIVPDPPKPDPDPDPEPEPEPEPAEEPGDDVVVGGDTDASSTGRAGGGSSVGPGIMAGFNSDSGQDGNSMQGLLKNLFVRPAALTAMAMQQSLPGGFEVDALAREVRDVLASTEFNSSLDRMREGVSDSTIFHQSVVGSGVAVTTGLSVGYVAWLVRGGVLLSTALSSLPAWQFIDPLPVLARTNEDDEDGSDDSLQSIIKEESARAANKAKETDKESGASGAAERSE